MKISLKPTFFSGRLTISVPFEFQNSFVFVGFPKHTPHLFHVHASVTPMQMRSSYVNKVGRERERERDLACACGVRVCFLQSWLKNLKDPSPPLSSLSIRPKSVWIELFFFFWFACYGSCCCRCLKIRWYRVRVTITKSWPDPFRATVPLRLSATLDRDMKLKNAGLLIGFTAAAVLQQRLWLGFITFNLSWK